MFDEKKYTEEAILEELSLMERHARDGSALNAGCSCIQEKHTLNISGLASEATVMEGSPKEKDFYAKIAEFNKKARHEIIDGTFNFPQNPTGRKYHPSGLTECEKSHPHVLKKLASCIRQVEKREGCVSPYTDCPVNPVAVCRASVKCP
jgi:hypothetical protein